MDAVSLVVAALSLVLSGLTAWLTLGRRGNVKVAQLPTVFFGPDGNLERHPKVFIRALLYSTASRGTLVEGMYLRLRRGDSVQTFPVWVHGPGRGNLARGAGVLAPQMGVAGDHHFLLPSDGSTYTFLAGNYHLDLFALVVNKRDPVLLTSIGLEVTPEQAKTLREDTSRGLYFDWGPDTRRYIGSIKDARVREDRELSAFLDAMTGRPRRLNDQSRPRELVAGPAEPAEPGSSSEDDTPKQATSRLTPPPDGSE